MNHQTVFVTGATGFVGRHLIEDLLRNGCQKIHVMVRNASYPEWLKQPHITVHEASLRDTASLIKAMPVECDIVFHIAANTTIWKKKASEQIEDNWMGTRNIVEAALKNRIRRFVHVSSIAVWDYEEGVLSEEKPKKGKHSRIPYSFSKYMAEEEVRKGIEQGLDAVIANPAHILGPYDRGNWIRMFKMVHSNSLPGVPGGTGSFADAREVAKALVAASQYGRTGENYLLGGPNISFLELVGHMGRLLERDVPKRTVPDWVLMGVGLMKDAFSRISGSEPDITPQGARHATARISVDDQKARSQLGYKHTPIETLLTDTIVWLKETDQITS